MTETPDRHGVVLFEGSSTWLWDGVNWSDVSPTTSPSARSLATMVLDERAGQVILFGGGTGCPGTSCAVLGDTWAWNGAAWQDVSPTSGSTPAARYGAAMAYDSVRRQTVLFGGFDAAGAALGDTWLWDGAGWTDVTPTSGGPSARGYSAMAFNAATKQAVLIGGVRDDGVLLSETWGWDGSAWSALTANVAIYGAAAAFDDSTRQIIVFGGFGAQSSTYGFDGTTWVNLTPPAGSPSPSARAFSVMSYSKAARNVLLFGGQSTSASTLYSDTWTFDQSKGRK